MIKTVEVVCVTVYKETGVVSVASGDGGHIKFTLSRDNAMAWIPQVGKTARLFIEAEENLDEYTA